MRYGLQGISARIGVEGKGQGWDSGSGLGLQVECAVGIKNKDVARGEESQEGNLRLA